MSVESRIHVYAFDDEVWQILETEPTIQSSLIDNNCNLNLFEITAMVTFVNDNLSGKAIAIADSYDNRTDQHTSCVYTLGDGVKEMEFNYDYEPTKANMINDTQIEDIHGWFNYANFELSEKEINTLNKIPSTPIL